MSKVITSTITSTIPTAEKTTGKPVMPIILPPTVAKHNGLATVSVKVTQVPRDSLETSAQKTTGKSRLPIIAPRKLQTTDSTTAIKIPESASKSDKPTIKPMIKLAVKVSAPPKPVKLTDYKLRADSIENIEDLYNLADFGDTVTNLVIQKNAIGFPDVDVSFTSPLSIDEILALLASLEDAHVAIQSLDYAEKYTGERFRDDEVVEKKDPKQNPKKIPESCIREPGSVWPDQNYIDTLIGSIEHQLKFQDRNTAEVQNLYKECEKARESNSKAELDATFANLLKQFDAYLDSLPPEAEDEE